MKHAYIMTVIDGWFCVGLAREKQTREAFQSLCLTGVRVWVVIAPQSLWGEIGER